MRFTKLMLVLSVGGTLFTGNSFGQSHEEMAREVKRISEERARQMVESGLLDDVRPPERRDNQYTENAKALSTQSMLDMSDSMVRYGFADADQATAFSDQAGYASSLNQNTLEPRQMYLSFAMGEDNLRAAIQSAARQGSTVFFNGLKPGDRTIDDMMTSIHQVIEGMDDLPNIRFNPYGFEYYGIKTVPTLTYTAGGYTTMVSGITGFEWLEDRHSEEGADHDFGEYGPTVEVSERNLLDEIEERYKALNMETRKEQAVARFWERQDFELLPQASEDETWYIDPTVRVNKDITNPNGEVLARAGTVVNPLRNAPMHATYITFDATSNEQIEFVERYLNENSFSGTVMLITSRIDRVEGWDHLQSLRDNFQREIYMLQKEMVSRFGLKALPTVISTDLDKYALKIQQFTPVKEDE